MLTGTHVDDTLLCTNYPPLREAFIKYIKGHFPMQDFERVSNFLGVGFKQDVAKGTVVLDQRGAVEALLQELDVSHTCHRKIPLPPGVKILPYEGECTDAFRKECQSKVAKCIYLQGCDPSMCQAVSKLASVASNPSSEHMKLLNNCLLPCLGKHDVDRGMQCSRNSCCSGPASGDPALRWNN